jgi:hypothetical protein
MQWGLLDPNAPMKAAQAPMQGASAAQELINSKNRNKLLQMQMAEFEANAPVREMQRQVAMQEGQEFLDPANIDARQRRLEQGVETADQLLDAGEFKRRERLFYDGEWALENRDFGRLRAIGEKLDLSDEHMALIDRAEVGDKAAIESIANFIESGKDLGRLNRLNNDNLPASLKEFEAVQAMSPEQRELFWRVKRDQRSTVNIGGVPYGYDQSTMRFYEITPGAAAQAGMPPELSMQEAAAAMGGQPQQPAPNVQQPPQAQPSMAVQPSMPQAAPPQAPDIGPPPSNPAELAAYNKRLQESAVHQAKLDNMLPEAAAEFEAKLVKNVDKDIGMAEYIWGQSVEGIQAIDRAIANVQANPDLATGFGARLFLGKQGKEGREGANAITLFIADHLADDAQGPATDLKSDLETVLGVVAFASLNSMRQASPTGGALGQVSNFEIALLKAQMTALDQEGSAKSIEERLGLIRNSLSIIKEISQIERGAGIEIAQGANPRGAMLRAFDKVTEAYKAHGRDPGKFESGVYYGVTPDSQPQSAPDGEESIEDIIKRNQ